MTQIDVTLTDYGLAGECASLGVLLAIHREHGSSLMAWYVIFFFSICAAALTGGTVHGFFLHESSMGYRLLWPLTLMVIGVTALAGICIGARIEFNRSAVDKITWAASAFFLIYCCVVLWVRRDFLIAILGYLPSMLFLGAIFLRAYYRRKNAGFLTGFIGICIMLLAAAAQQAKIGLHPHYFNHNAVYHVLQAAGLLMVYYAARESSSLQESLP